MTRSGAATLVLAALLAGACSDDGPGPVDGTHGSEQGTTRDGVGTGDGKGKSGVGGPCTRDSDCAQPPGAKCFRTIGGGMVPTITFPGGYCSRDCSTEPDSGTADDCGKGGGCAKIGMSGGSGSVTLTMCTRSCTKVTDCRVAEGYTCKFVFFGIGYCMMK